MRKELKYKVRRTIFMYIPMISIIAGIEVLAFIKAGLFMI